MTLIETMENIAAFLQSQLLEYDCKLADGNIVPVAVYPGFAPIRNSNEPIQAFVYVLATDSSDSEPQSQAKVEIGISVEDTDRTDGWRSMYNLAEHIRISLLKHRLIAHKHRLILPLKFFLGEERLYPQWTAGLTAEYTIGQPVEEELDYGD